MKIQANTTPVRPLDGAQRETPIPPLLIDEKLSAVGPGEAGRSDWTWLEFTAESEEQFSELLHEH